MADDTDTPPTGPTTGSTSGSDTASTPRRRGPRKTGTAATTTKRRAPAASNVDKAEAAVKSTATRVKRSAVKAETAVVEAVKAVKPRAVGRPKSSTASARKTPTKRAPAKTTAKTSKWGVAAIAGGLAAAGAAAAALLSLKGSTAKGSTPTEPDKGAHQPDGADSSKSFAAGIADENSVPN